MTLTKTETAILANAAKRESRNLLPLPRFIFVRGLSVVVALEKLIRRGLVAERQASGDDPVWRTGRAPMTLSLSDAGLAALQDGDLADDRAPPAWHDGAAQDTAPTQQEMIAEDDRQSVLMAIMSHPHGADVKSIQAETGLPLQSVRAAISGLRADGYVFDHVRDPAGTITYQLIGWLPGDGGLEHARASGHLHS